MIPLCDIWKHPNQLLNSVFFFSDNIFFFKVSEYVPCNIKNLKHLNLASFLFHFGGKDLVLGQIKASMLSPTKFSRVVSGLIYLRLVRLASGGVVLAQSLYLEGRGTETQNS